MFIIENEKIHRKGNKHDKRMMKLRNDWKTRVCILILFNTTVIYKLNFSGVRWNPDVKTVESTLSVSIAVWMIFE